MRDQELKYYPAGIYAIHNVTKDIFYIGSSENIEKRWKQHQKMLIKNGYINLSVFKRKS